MRLVLYFRQAKLRIPLVVAEYVAVILALVLLKVFFINFPELAFEQIDVQGTHDPEQYGIPLFNLHQNRDQNHALVLDPLYHPLFYLICLKQRHGFVPCEVRFLLIYFSLLHYLHAETEDLVEYVEELALHQGVLDFSTGALR